ncbi:MAG: hypothetical protein GAK35_02648 [Herbaspirillum frisingense]|uniref:Tim44-like domain-containing protein n=1 Tax=Herbaspirillum frisingense TaxID=92645 RepID=A0A7V8JU05_9BURK|nr:MAG: hypothetical protein GAK35_02648 [Herbaspirillum frisingense]
MKAFVVSLTMVMSATAFAGSISRGGSSFSASRASSSPARSMGAVRPSVVPSTPKPTNTPPARPVPSTSPRYARTPTPRASPPEHISAPAAAAPSSGGTFLSSFGGSFLGSMLGSNLGSHGGGSTVVNNNGGVPASAGAAGNDGGYSGAASSYAQASGESTLSRVFAWILGAAVVAAGLVALTLGLVHLRRRQKAAEEAAQEEADRMPFSPVGLFNQLQRAFAGKDEPALRRLLGPDMVDQLLANLPEEKSVEKLANITSEVLDRSPNVISVHFTADDLADNTKLNEVWHFRRFGTAWQLNGINVLPAA